MLDRAEFQSLVHDALARLYDASHLQRHPLASLLTLGRSHEAPGRVLRRLLLDAIQDLKPPPGAPPDAQVAQRYQFLYLRYVRGESIAQVARSLAVTERQAYRRQHEAVEAVSAIVWPLARLPEVARALPARPGTGPGVGPLVSAAASGELRQSLECEVDRIGRTQPRAPIDLRLVIEGVLGTVGQLSRTRGHAISLEIDGHPPPVAVDATAIRQAILGLLLFADDLSHGGDIHLAVSSGDAEVVLRVESRCSAPLGEDDSNLMVSRRLVELQGGTLEAGVADGQLEAVIALPAAREPAILVVDDNQDTVQLFTRYLAGAGYRVQRAATGEEALRLVGESLPDAVILDVMLPAADGWEVLQALRSHPDTASLPVVVCTVLKHQELAFSLGATDFVRKPATRGALLTAVERGLRLEERGAGGREAEGAR